MPRAHDAASGGDRDRVRRVGGGVARRATQRPPIPRRRLRSRRRRGRAPSDRHLRARCRRGSSTGAACDRRAPAGLDSRLRRRRAWWQRVPRARRSRRASRRDRPRAATMTCDARRGPIGDHAASEPRDAGRRAFEHPIVGGSREAVEEPAGRHELRTLADREQRRCGSDVTSNPRDHGGVVRRPAMQVRHDEQVRCARHQRRVVVEAEVGKEVEAGVARGVGRERRWTPLGRDDAHLERAARGQQLDDRQRVGDLGPVVADENDRQRQPAVGGRGPGTATSPIGAASSGPPWPWRRAPTVIPPATAGGITNATTSSATRL